jgi:hypothetical protein
MGQCVCSLRSRGKRNIVECRFKIHANAIDLAAPYDRLGHTESLRNVVEGQCVKVEAKHRLGVAKQKICISSWREMSSKELRRSTARMARSSDLLENNMLFQRVSWKMRASRICVRDVGFTGHIMNGRTPPMDAMGWPGDTLMLGTLARKLLICISGTYK